jgi:hypothetical protein
MRLGMAFEFQLAIGKENWKSLILTTDNVPFAIQRCFVPAEI